MFGIAQWYIYQQRSKPLSLGATFIPSYANYLGVDPKETLQAMVDDLGIRRLRLVSYWNTIEKQPGIYDFSELDWQFRLAEEKNVKVSLAIGLRQPRWPECHMPDWARNQPKLEWELQLKSFIGKVVERYRASPALDSYQLENEFLLRVFGECEDFDRQRLIDEYNIVKRLDPVHPVLVSRSNAFVGFPVSEPVPDLYGISIYKRTWGRLLTNRYVELPFPSWFYSFLAGGSKIINGKDTIVHELQAEAWMPPHIELPNAPKEEIAKSMDADRLRKRFEFARATGIKTIDLWGAEWWYHMKVKRGDPSLWEVAKTEFQQTR